MELLAVIDLISSGHFSHGDCNLFRPLLDSLLTNDPYLLLADYQAYIDCQDQVSQVYRDRDRWLQMSIFNTARTGKFSSDRSIREYCEDIWHAQPVEVEIADYVQAQAGLLE
ncbi:MAG: glycogen/starch/alpha-glucan phosphorylase [Oculatellaceae cyanobacterium bins.114]|nr:glycogen/starch/alpha-glucan phosphorylase [Oculatellaceae cyanobacterium bins.114]